MRNTKTITLHTCDRCAREFKPENGDVSVDDTALLTLTCSPPDRSWPKAKHSAEFIILKQTDLCRRCSKTVQRLVAKLIQDHDWLEANHTSRSGEVTA